MATLSEASLNNPNAGLIASGFDNAPGTSVSNAPSAPPAVPTTQNASAVGSQQSNPSSVIFPPAPTPASTASTGANTSIPNPIPTASSIINQDTPTTPAETKQKSILDRIAGLIGGNQSQQTLTNAAESAADVPHLTKTVNDLNTQLEGLNNQGTALANEAGQYGAIQNQERLNESGGNIQAAMHGRPEMKDALLQNQIKQSAIASQALTLKSAIYGAQGQLTLAKDSADKAAIAQFQDQQNQLDYQKALLDANAPLLSKQEKIQAMQVQADLADRQTQITNGIDDKKTIIAMATAAMKNNPSDPAAQYAAQQALAESNKQQPDLKAALALVGKYQQDPLAIEKQIADIAKTRADTAKTNKEISQLNNPGGTQDISSLTSQAQTALKSNGFTAYNTSTQSLASQLVNGQIAPAELSKRTTGSSSYNDILTAADKYSMATTGKHYDISKADRDYKFATNVQTQNTLNFLTSLVGTDNGSGTPQGGNLDQLISQSNARKATGPTNPFNPFKGSNQGLPALNNVEQWTKLQTGDPAIAAYYGTLVEVSDQVAKILQGGGAGGGTSDAKLAQAQSLFQKGFTPDQISAVATSLKGLLANRAKGMIGDNPYLSDYADKLGTKTTPSTSSNSGTTQMIGSDGKVWSVPPDKVELFKQNGYKQQSFNSVGGDTNQASNISIPNNTLASMNNNPGNLRYAGQAGASSGHGGFALFSTVEAGFNALVNQIKLDAGRGLSLSAFISKFAPPSENNTQQYIQQIAQATSSSPTAKISSIDAHKLAKAMAFKESGTKFL